MLSYKRKVGWVMKKNTFISVLTIILMLFCISGCSSDKVGINILEQSKNYTGPFDMPSIKEVDEGSALWILASINENGYKIKSATKTKSDDQSMIESYKINCYDVYIELFYYRPTSEKLAEITETGKYIIYNSSGDVLKEYTAYVNGQFVLFFGSNKDFEGNDRSKDNAKVAQIFMDLDWSLQP